jgi:hypothetical protein
VKRPLLSLAIVGGLATVVAVVVAGAPRARAVDAFVLFLGALLMAWLVQRTRRASGADLPSSYERSLRAPPSREETRPASLARLERIVYLAAMNAFDVHMRLRPRLRTIAGHRLASRRGLRLDSLEADDQLGDELAALLRPDRPRPDDPFGPGMPLERQRDALERLERI